MSELETERTKIPNDSDVCIGTIFDGRFEIFQCLGAGGMGTVYKARETGLGRIVALKFFNQTCDDNTLQRLRRELITSAASSHTNVVQVFSAGIGGGVPYLVMEYVEGRTLKEHIEQKSLPDLSSLKSVFMQILQGLSHAHSAGVIHRDLKPSNIMLTKDGEAKILDFGVARLVQPSVGDQKLTRTGAIVGSASYMSPEQCACGELDVRADLYSLGCVLYECVEGHPPFCGDNEMEVMYKHLHEPVVPPKKAPAHWQSFLLKALAKEPEKRFSSAEDMLAALQKLEVGEPAPQKSNVLPWAIAGVVLVVVATAALRLFGSRAPSHDLEPKLADRRISWKQAKSEAETSIRTASWDKALLKYKGWLRRAEQNPTTDPDEIQEAKFSIAKIDVLHKGKFEEHAKLIETLSADMPAWLSPSDKVQVCYILAQIYLRRKCIQDAYDQNQRLLKLAEGQSLNQSAHFNVACAYQFLAQRAADETDYVLAEEYTRKCIDAQQRADVDSFSIIAMWLSVAGYLEQQGRIAEAHDLFEKQVAQARRLYEQKNVDSPYHQQAQATLSSALNSLAVFEGAHGNPVKARTLLDQGLKVCSAENNHLRAGMLIQKAVFLNREKKYAAALACANEADAALQRVSDSLKPGLFYALGHEYMNAGEKEKALSAWREAAFYYDRAKGYDFVWNAAYDIITTEGSQDPSVCVVRNASRLSSAGKSMFWGVLAVEYCKQKRSSEAIELFRKSLAGLGDDASQVASKLRITVYLARLLRQEGRLKESQEMLSAIIAKFDAPGIGKYERAISYLELITVLVESGDAASAVPLIEKARHLEKELKSERVYPQFLYMAGRCAAVQKKYDEAMRIFEELRGSVSKDSSLFVGALINEGYTLSLMGKPDEAMARMHEAELVAVKGHHYRSLLEAVKAKGDICFYLGRHEQSEKCYLQTLQLAERKPSAVKSIIVKTAADRLNEIYAMRKDTAATTALQDRTQVLMSKLKE